MFINTTKITYPTGWPYRPYSILRHQLHRWAMRLVSCLEYARSSGVSGSIYFFRVPYRQFIYPAIRASVYGKTLKYLDISFRVLLACLVFMTMSDRLQAAGRQVYYDYAPVLSVRPIVETEKVPVRHKECHDVPDQGRVTNNARLAGDVRLLEPGFTLGEMIRRDTERRLQKTVRRCETLRRYKRREQVVGYDVRYSYRGDVFVRRLDYHPGESIRVRVELNPLY